MDLFSKLKLPQLAEEIRAAGVYPIFTSCKAARTLKSSWKVNAGLCWEAITIWA